MSGLIYDAIMEIEASITSRLFYHQHFFSCASKLPAPSVDGDFQFVLLFDVVS